MAGTRPTGVGHSYPSGTIAGGLGTANREDILDVITNISPTQTPFFSGLAKGSCDATTHEWPKDELAAPADNQLIEGGDATFANLADRTRDKNFTQIFTKPYAVSRTQERVKKAGVRSEVAYQGTKALKELVRDMEFACWTNTLAGNDGTATSGDREMKPVDAFIDSGNVVDASSAVVTEDMVNNALQLAWDEGGDPESLFVSGTVKRRITKVFTAASQRSLEMTQNAERRLINRIDVYESEFSVLRIIPDRWIPTNLGVGTNETGVYGIEMDHWGFDFIDEPFSEDLAKTGASMKKWWYAEGTLVGRAPKANCKVENVLNALA